MTKQKFFFEEDPTTSADTESGITWDEHADTFFGALEDAGLLVEKDDMAPKQLESRYDTKFRKTALLEIEHGIIQDDYVLHITPLHHRKNLDAKVLLAEAVKSCVQDLNSVVPFALKVRIHIPQDNWEIKTTSFIIEKGADAWDLDRKKMDEVLVPIIEKKVSDICMKAP